MSASGGPVDRATLEDLAAASRILVDQGVFDAAGHASMRHPSHPERFLMSRSLAPQLVTADDIMEFDLDCNAIDPRGRNGFIERYLHGEIFRARPDVMAVAHSHSPSVIAFGLSNTPMRAMYHNAAFLAAGVPVFDIREKFGATDIVISTAAKGAALAAGAGRQAGGAAARARHGRGRADACRSRCFARSSPTSAPASSTRRWRSAARSRRSTPRRGGLPTWSMCRPSAARGICGREG